MRNFLRRLLAHLGCIPARTLVAREQEIHPTPEQLTEGSLIIVRDGGLAKAACLLCPGGCGEKIVLNLSPRRKPTWRITVDWLGRPTAEPSVRQLNRCGCHFWIKRGAIDWCADTPGFKRVPWTN